MASTDDSSQKVKIESASGVATVTLNNPPLNILSSDVKDRLTEAFLELRRDPSIRVTVLTSAPGSAFCAGADLKEFPSRIEKQNAYEVSKQGHLMSAAIREAPFPVLVAVDGVAFGGGAELTLMADFRIASESSTFAFPEIKRGVFPGTSGSQLLPQVVGAMHAKRLMMLGETINADEAFRIGLLTEVTNGDPRPRAMEFARQLSDMPRVAVAGVKKLVDSWTNVDLATGLELESALFFRAFTTADAREGAAAFLEKRAPKFSHR